jgi:hypothetical protein
LAEESAWSGWEVRVRQSRATTIGDEVAEIGNPVCDEFVAVENGNDR